MRLYILLLLLFGNIVYANNILDKNNFHGYLNYTKIDTSGSEFFTDGYIGLGLNYSYQINNRLFFTTQISSRNVIETKLRKSIIDSLRIEYLKLNISLYENNKSQHSLAIGRIKVPYGFYNKTRDTPITLPSILLPQSVYIEKLRDFALSANGGIYKYSRFNDLFNIEIDLGAGYTIIDDLTKLNFYPMFFNQIKLKPKLSYILNISLNSNDMKYRFNYSYLETDIKTTLPTKVNFRLNVFSFQYNFDKFSWTNEFSSSDGDVTNNFGIGTVGDGWYTQLEYFITPKLILLGRYEKSDIIAKSNPPRLNEYRAKSLNIKYKLFKNTNLNFYYSKNIGTMPLFPINIRTSEPLHIQKHWDLMMLSIDYKF